MSAMPSILAATAPAHPPVAASCDCAARSAAASQAVGVSQPSVLRGRALSSAATAASWLGAVDAQVGALREVLAQQPVGVLVGRPLPGRVAVSQKNTGMPSAWAISACSAISLP